MDDLINGSEPKKYIESSYLLNLLDERKDTRYDYLDRYDVMSAPAVDAETVRHGQWLINSDGYYPYCSECKEEPKSGIMTHYCPNCGCKMVLDGKDDNE